MAESSGQPLAGRGAAWRRRQRRLRSWLRHEQQTVAAVLATVSHHSYSKVDTAHDGLRAQRTVTITREEVERATYNVPRHQKTPLPGKRPGLPPEPEPLGRAVTDGYVAAQEPLQVVPSLVGGDNIDGTTLQFFLEHCLKMKMLLEEEERRKEEEREKEKALTARARSSASSGPKRSRKKRRKKKAPRGFRSRSSLSGALCCPLVVGRPEMLGIMASMYQKDSSALFVDSGSGMCKAGYGLRFVFPSVVVRRDMLGIMAGTYQKDSYTLLVDIGGMLCTSHCVSFPVVRPKMPCILAGMDQKDLRVFKVVNIPVVAQRLFPWSRRARGQGGRCPVMLVFPSMADPCLSASWSVWMWPRSSLFRQWHDCYWCAGYDAFALCSLRLSAGPWSLHRCSSWTRLWACLSWFNDRCRGPDSAYWLEVPQLQLIFKDVDFPVVAQRLSHRPDDR